MSESTRDTEKGRTTIPKREEIAEELEERLRDRRDRNYEEA
jgi:hypothetical protein